MSSNNHAVQAGGRAQCIPSRPGYLPGIYLRKLLELAEAEGLHAESLLGTADRLVRGRFPSGRSWEYEDVRYQDYLTFVRKLLDNLARTTPGFDGAIGIRFGRSFDVRDYGILGYAMLSCQNLEECLQTWVRLDNLFGSVAELDHRCVWREDEFSYQCTAYHMDEEISRFELETATSQFVALKNLLVEPDRFRLSRVNFSFQAPGVTEDYDQHFACPVHFGQPLTEVVVNRAVIKEPFSLANREAQALCQDQCELLLKSMGKIGLVSESVRRLLVQSPGNIPELADVAHQLHVSSRTLRRKLAREGTTYHAILKDVRECLAKHYLSDSPMEIKEISYLLGYSEVANFQRAFKRWVGNTPGEYRSARSR